MLCSLHYDQKCMFYACFMYSFDIDVVRPSDDIPTNETSICQCYIGIPFINMKTLFV